MGDSSKQSVGLCCRYSDFLQAEGCSGVMRSSCFELARRSELDQSMLIRWTKLQTDE